MPEKANKSNVPIDGFEKPISVAPLATRPLVAPKDVISALLLPFGALGSAKFSVEPAWSVMPALTVSVPVRFKTPAPLKAATVWAEF